MSQSSCRRLWKHAGQPSISAALLHHFYVNHCKFGQICAAIPLQVVGSYPWSSRWPPHLSFSFSWVLHPHFHQNQLQYPYRFLASVIHLGVTSLHTKQVVVLYEYQTRTCQSIYFFFHISSSESYLQQRTSTAADKMCLKEPWHTFTARFWWWWAWCIFFCAQKYGRWTWPFCQPCIYFTASTVLCTQNKFIPSHVFTAKSLYSGSYFFCLFFHPSLVLIVPFTPTTCHLRTFV